MFRLLLFVSLLLMSPLFSQESAYGQVLFINHPATTTLKQKQVELSLEYGLVNNTVDIFNIKSQEVSKKRAEGSFGDYNHLKAHINIGLTDKDMLLGEFIIRDINYGTSSITAYHYELGYRHSFAPWFALDLIFKANEADDVVFTDVNDLNSTVHKIDPRLSIDSITPLYIWFFKTGDTSIKVGIPYEQTPYASLTDMYDLTGSARLTFGHAFESIYPNFFVESGYTYASTTANTNLFDSAPDYITEKVPSMPLDLSHEEIYVTAGINAFFHLPWNFGGYAEANYQYFFRDKQFTEGNSNQTLILELNYAFTPRLSAAVSGIYLNQQLNGSIPFLYNEQSQYSFDHKYGWAAIALSYLW